MPRWNARPRPLTSRAALRIVCPRLAATSPWWKEHDGVLVRVRGDAAVVRKIISQGVCRRGSPPHHPRRAPGGALVARPVHHSIRAPGCKWLDAVARQEHKTALTNRRGTHRQDTSLPQHASQLTISPDAGMGPPPGAGGTDADARWAVQRVPRRADVNLPGRGPGLPRLPRGPLAPAPARSDSKTPAAGPRSRCSSRGSARKQRTSARQSLEQVLD